MIACVSYSNPAVVLERRNAAERVARQVRLLLRRAELHRGKFVVRALLFQRKQRSAYIRAAGNAVNDHA
jgi:hypothetical protein